MDRGFTPSKIDQFLYMKKGMIVLVYVSDCIIVGDDMTKIDNLIESMQNGPENFILTDEGNINKFLGIEIKRLGKQEFEISQPSDWPHSVIPWIGQFIARFKGEQEIYSSSVAYIE